jgi:preprotein translocase subunit SecA
MMGFLDKLFRSEKDRQLKKLKAQAERVNSLEPKYSAMSDEELAAQTQIFKKRLEAGESLDEILYDAYAAVREASKRVLNMRHFDVQIIGGIVLHQGRIAEMQTGEGKTLVATLPAYLNALTGKGVHIVTVNDYLAKRDAEWMGKIYRFMGLTVGVVLPDMDFEAKKQAYAADITYATNNEAGFDYLRDNMAISKEGIMQRGHHFAIVDEVDSILIDEARTPLIISGQAGESSEIYIKANRFVNILNDKDYVLEEKDRHIYLSEEGIEKAERFFHINNLGDAENAELMIKINNALRANYLMHRDKDYIVEDNQLFIVDEFTGRKMDGRRYSEGLHQAIEAKENVQIKRENRTIATITFQNYFRMYAKLSGMTGTALTEEGEFKGIYNLDVVPIPTNKPMIRKDEPDKVYITKQKKYENIIKDIAECHKRGQPVLVGTTNVETSELLSDMLRKEGIKHNVLNAKRHKEEAAIIAQAGTIGAVTIATNMAGRGTDILLGGNPDFKARQKMLLEGFTDEQINAATAYHTLTDEQEIKARVRYKEVLAEYAAESEKEKLKVLELGGLRVIGTERHEARRIDNQLRGRSGRQGDPGSSCFYLSFEDDLLRLFGGDRLKAIVTSLSGDEEMMIQLPMLSKQIENAQKRCEENNYARRKYVLNYDDVMNKQRQLIYGQRNEVLEGKDIHDQILKFVEQLCEEIVGQYIDFTENDETTIDYAAVNTELELKVLDKGTNIITPELCGRMNIDLIEKTVYETAVKQYEDKIARAKENGIDFGEIERIMLLRVVDGYWRDHIDAMDMLRKGIGLRGYGQRDPVMEYRREGFEMFDEMVEAIRRTTAIRLLKADVDRMILQVQERRVSQMQREADASRRVTYVNRDANKSVGRNDPCPCGSGRKYKNCCGK